MNSNQELKWLTAQARKAGYQVGPGRKGGGWIRLAMICGYEAPAKSYAKTYLRKLFASQFGAAAPAIPKPKRKVAFESTDAFLASYEWRRVRMQALKKYGSRCQCCGATPADGLRMNVDHIKPRKLFPQLALDVTNLQVLCEVCNHGKGNWDMTDWRDSHEPVNPDIGEAERQHIRSILEGK